MSSSSQPSLRSELLQAAMVKSKHVAIFIPSCDRNGASIDHDYWRNEAVRLLSTLFGGATSLNSFGGWCDVERGGQIIEEKNSIVFSFMDEDDWTESNVIQIRDFAFRMGREAKQGAIGLHVMGSYLEIPSSQYE